VSGERVKWGPAQGLWAGAAVPFGLRYLRQAGEHIDLNLRLLAHGGLDLLVPFKMRHVRERSRQITLKSDIVGYTARAALFIWGPYGPAENGNALSFQGAYGGIFQFFLIVRNKPRARGAKI
jgi:hypothetical protein